MKLQSYPKNYRNYRRKAGRGRGGPPQGRAHQLVIQYQMVNPENIHTSSIIQTAQVISMNISEYTYMHTISEKRGNEFGGV